MYKIPYWHLFKHRECIFSFGCSVRQKILCPLNSTYKWSVDHVPYKQVACTRQNAEQKPQHSSFHKSSTSNVDIGNGVCTFPWGWLLEAGAVGANPARPGWDSGTPPGLRRRSCPKKNTGMLKGWHGAERMNSPACVLANTLTSRACAILMLYHQQGLGLTQLLQASSGQNSLTHKVCQKQT